MRYFETVEQEQEYEEKMALLFLSQKVRERSGISWEHFISRAKAGTLGNLTWIGVDGV